MFAAQFIVIYKKSQIVRNTSELCIFMAVGQIAISCQERQSRGMSQIL